MSDSVGRDPKRSAGVLLHPTSLPGLYGAGDLGDELIAFLDWAASAGMHLWQVLPLNPPGYGNSPYNCVSSISGNPLLISPQRLLQEHLILPEDVADVPSFALDHADFDRVVTWKTAVLRKAWKRFEGNGLRAEFERFCTDEKEWLDD